MVKQGGDEQATLTVQQVRLGASEEANTVSPMKLDWNQPPEYLAIKATSSLSRKANCLSCT